MIYYSKIDSLVWNKRFPAFLGTYLFKRIISQVQNFHFKSISFPILIELDVSRNTFYMNLLENKIKTQQEKSPVKQKWNYSCLVLVNLARKLTQITLVDRCSGFKSRLPRFNTESVIQALQAVVFPISKQREVGSGLSNASQPSFQRPTSSSYSDVKRLK